MVIQYIPVPSFKIKATVIYWYGWVPIDPIFANEMNEKKFAQCQEEKLSSAENCHWQVWFNRDLL